MERAADVPHSIPQGGGNDVFASPRMRHLFELCHQQIDFTFVPCHDDGLEVLFMGEGLSPPRFRLADLDAGVVVTGLRLLRLAESQVGSQELPVEEHCLADEDGLDAELIAAVFTRRLEATLGA